MTIDRNGHHETDKRFPSGIWVGYWMQGYIKGRMRLTLEFINGAITGEGSDPVGTFKMKGIYSLRHNMVSMSKRYYGAHSVGYVGGAADGGLNGTWQIRSIPQIDEWRLWPLVDKVETVHHAVESEDAPIVLIDEVEDIEEELNAK